MLANYLKRLISLSLAVIVTISLCKCGKASAEKEKPRILISTDIGGTDPDDFQSMIHLLMYADRFKLEGLVSSPFGKGRKKDLLDMINLYEKDFPQLNKHASGFPVPASLRKICKQGAIKSAPFKGFDTATEGSEWIIESSKKPDDLPLWILVWGGLEDLAQALHDAPEIKRNIKVYWIGGPNKKWSINAYSYIAENHPDLWMIEANATYRGWFIDSESPKNITNETYYDNYIKGHGTMGHAFQNYYNGNIKMGDTPSLAYTICSNPDDHFPDDKFNESWGGNFTAISFSSHVIFDGSSTIADTVATFSTLEWRFKGPTLPTPQDSTCFVLKISNQDWPGYYLGDGIYAVRYSPKKPEVGTYLTASNFSELNGLKGQYVSVDPWPGKQSRDDYKLGYHWYSDRQEPEMFIDGHQGARTISRHRQEFLLDWAKRWEWLH